MSESHSVLAPLAMAGDCGLGACLQERIAFRIGACKQGGACLIWRRAIWPQCVSGRG